MVGFDPNMYMFNGGMGDVSLMLVVSSLGSGILECPVNVSIVYTDGPKAGKLLLPCNSYSAYLVSRYHFQFDTDLYRSLYSII